MQTVLILWSNMTNDASVMVMWYSSFGIRKNTRLCYSCIMVDLNCGHRINQEVKVWRWGSSLNINPNTVFWQPTWRLLTSNTHTFLIGAVMHWSLLPPVVSDSSCIHHTNRFLDTPVVPVRVSACMFKSLFIPKTYKYAVHPRKISFWLKVENIHCIITYK